MNAKNTLSLLLVLFVSVSAEAQHEDHLHHQHDKNEAATLESQIPSPSPAQDSLEQTMWTCSMHPQIKLAKAGKCPICGMDLIPVEPTSDQRGEETPSLTLSDRASKLMEVKTTVVKRKWAERSVRLVGKIDYDETRVKHITAWVPGRIDRMFVDYTGIEVKQNDHMVSLFSPELVSAQEELIQAARSVGRIKGGSEMVKRSSARSLEAARSKLQLLGLTASQVRQIEKRGQATDSVTVYSPMGGTVVEKHVNQGVYVQTGTKIYTIADLSHLWLTLDAYESDMPWIAYGQQVEFLTEALPGETFSGVVSFVHPILDEKTRTVKVRVNVDNKSEQLKPGMFVTAIIKAQVDSDGRVLATSYSGKFVCPMHPEVVTESKGSCPVCGMDLVNAESLPFVQKSHKHKPEAP